MNLENRKAIIGIGAGLLAFFILTRIFNKKDEKPKAIVVTDESIDFALRAYVPAIEDGAPVIVLQDINKELKDKYGITVSFSQASGRYTVKDSSGKIVKEA